MKTIQVYGLTFRVTHEHDHDAEAPWHDDGHGPVSDWRHHATQREGELVLQNGPCNVQFYDFAEACKIALRDGWDGCTNEEEAREAAQNDFDHLRNWVVNEWNYIGVICVLLDIEGNDTDAQWSTWRVEDNGSAADTIAYDCALNIINFIAKKTEFGDFGTRYNSGCRSWIITNN